MIRLRSAYAYAKQGNIDNASFLFSSLLHTLEEAFFQESPPSASDLRHFATYVARAGDMRCAANTLRMIEAEAYEFAIGLIGMATALLNQRRHGSSFMETHLDPIDRDQMRSSTTSMKTAMGNEPPPRLCLTPGTEMWRLAQSPTT